MNAIARLNAVKHVALIGGSDRAGSEAAAITANVFAGNVSTDREPLRISIVNPRHDSVAEQPCLLRIAQITGIPDLALILAPWAEVPSIIDQLARLGCRLAVILSRPRPSFFSPSDDPRGVRLLKSRAQAAKIRVLGPAVAGLIVPHLGLNASRVEHALEAGSVALLTANHSLFHLSLDHAQRLRRGFSLALDVGGGLDLGWADAIDLLAQHEPTRALMLASACMRVDRAGLSALRAFATRKPVLVLNTSTSRAHVSNLQQATFDRLGIPSTLAFAEWIEFQPNPPVEDPTQLTILSNSNALAALCEVPQAVLESAIVTDAPGARQLLDWLEPAQTRSAVPTLVIIDPSIEPDRAALEARLIELGRAGLGALAWCGVGEDAARQRLREHGIAVFADPQAALKSLKIRALSAALRTDARVTPPPLRPSLPWAIKRLSFGSTRAGRVAERDLRQALAELNISLLDETTADGLALDVQWHADPEFGPWLQLSLGTIVRVAPLPLDLKAIEALLSALTAKHDLATRWLRDGLYVLSEIFRLSDNLLQLQLNQAQFNPLGVRAVSALAIRGKRNVDTLIAPYPLELEELIDPELKIRPIRGEDEPELKRGFNRLTPEEVRMRFHYPLKALTHDLAAELSQIDYERQMAFILTTYQAPGLAPIFGVSRLSADPLERSAEFAIVIGRDYAGRGFGRKLMQKLIDHATRLGLESLWGDVLLENDHMLGLASALGFHQSPHPDEASLKRVILKL